MANVGTKRSPRLPLGPKEGEVIDIEPINKQETEQEIINEVNEKEIEIEQSEGFQPLKLNPKVPPPPLSLFKPKDIQTFYDWLASLTEESYQQISVYMYRSYPKIDKKKVDPNSDTNIDCFSRAIDEQWVLDNHGSGDYLFIVNDLTKPKNAKKVCSASIKGLDHPDYPPKVNMAELDVNYSGNRVYVDRMIAEGKLTVDKKPMNTQQNNGGLGQDALVGLITKLIDQKDRSQLSQVKDPRDSAITEAFAIMAKGSEASTKMMLENMKADDPEKLLKLVTLIMTMTNKPETKNDDGILKLLIESQAKNSELIQQNTKAQMDMMLKMMEIKSTPPPPSADESFLEKFLKYKDILVDGIGGGGGGGNVKKSTLEVILEHGAPLLSNVFGMIQNYMAMKANGVPTLQAEAELRKAGVVVPQTNNPNSNAAIAIADASGNNKGNGNVVDAMQQQTEDQMNLIKQGVAQMGPQIIGMIERGLTGDVFGQNIEDMYGPMAYQQIVGLGKDKILEALKSNQQVWSRLALVQPALNKFIDDFFEYGKDEPEDKNKSEGIEIE